MKNIFFSVALLSVLLISLNPSFAQKPGVKSEIKSNPLPVKLETYKAINNQTYKIGDTIRLGASSNFSNEYVYLVSGKEGIPDKVQSQVTIGGSVKTIDYRLNKKQIKGIYKYPDNRIYFILDKLFNQRILADSAILTGEIVCPDYEKLIRTPGIQLTDSLAYVLFMVKSNALTNENLKEYLFLYDHLKYQDASQDEFKLGKLISSSKKKILDSGIKYDSSKVYYQTFSLDMGVYDFDNHSFPLIMEKGERQVTRSKYGSTDVEKKDLITSEFRFNYINFDQYKSITLNENLAENFIAYRKNYGAVNRMVNVVCYLKIFDFIQSDKMIVVKTQITKNLIFEDPKYYNFLGVK